MVCVAHPHCQVMRRKCWCSPPHPRGDPHRPSSLQPHRFPPAKVAERQACSRTHDSPSHRPGAGRPRLDHRGTVTRLPLRSAAPAPPHPTSPPQPSPTPTRAAPPHPDRPDPPRFRLPRSGPPPTGQTRKAALGSAPPPDPHPRCACRPRRLPHARPRRSNHRTQDVLGRLTLVGDVNASPPAPHTCGTTKEKDAAPPAALRAAPEMNPGDPYCRRL